MSKGRLKEKIQFPVVAYEKWNGYLGIVSYNPHTNTLYTTSKSDSTGPHAHHLRKMLNETLSQEQRDFLTDYLKTNDVTAVFEVIDNKFDPHVIRYDEKQLILLAIVENTVIFKKRKYAEVVKLSETLGIKHARAVVTLHNWAEFVDFYEQEMTESPFDFTVDHVEGYVLEGADGFMTKIKKPFYHYWKFIRSQVYIFSKLAEPELALAKSEFSPVDVGIIRLGIKHITELKIRHDFNLISFMYSDEVQDYVKQNT